MRTEEKEKTRGALPGTCREAIKVAERAQPVRCANAALSSAVALPRSRSARVTGRRMTVAVTPLAEVASSSSCGAAVTVAVAEVEAEAEARGVRVEGNVRVGEGEAVRALLRDGEAVAEEVPPVALALPVRWPER